MKFKYGLSIFILFGINMLANALPIGFVYLDEIDPTIIQDLRYFRDENFVGRNIVGYKAKSAILTKEAALALSKVQISVNKNGYSLVIYDAYRPQKASDDFVKWSKKVDDNKMKTSYYPFIDKKDFFKLNYAGERSSHSRGSTVDLTIIEINKKIYSEPKVIKRQLLDGRSVLYLDDNTVDMYTSFDLMDQASNWNQNLIPVINMQRRLYLKDKMLKAGFKPFATEWWHYTLKDEPFKDQYFDFDIE